MAEKRRDNKNRILQTGESQRNDGRYCFKFVNNCGKIQFIYSWKLVPSDSAPKGKRDDISLREKEKRNPARPRRRHRHVREENDRDTAV